MNSTTNYDHPQRYTGEDGMNDLIKANEYLRRLIAFEDGGDSK